MSTCLCTQEHGTCPLCELGNPVSHVWYRPVYIVHPFCIVNSRGEQELIVEGPLYLQEKIASIKEENHERS